MANSSKTLLAMAVAAASASSFAGTQLTDNITVSGFGTLGYVRSSTDDADYIREMQAEGADRDGSLMVDSNLGLQVTAVANSWLSATAQTLTMRRGTDDISTRLEWAFVKATPVEGLALRAGKFSLPNFLISDSRRVGYANTWLRPANEVYGLDYLNGGLAGVDASYQVPIGSNQLTITGLYGRSSSYNRQFNLKWDVDHVKGINLVWDGGWYTARLGHVRGAVQFGSFAAVTNKDEDIYKFTGAGVTMDRNNVVLQGEYVMRRSSDFDNLIAANAWYLLGGYRFGQFLPYVEFAKVKSAKNSGVAPQKTTALGLRWDAFSSAAIKFQVEHVDTDGTAGISFYDPSTKSTPALGKAVNTISVAVDFVF